LETNLRIAEFQSPVIKVIATTTVPLRHCDKSYTSASHWLLPDDTYEKQAYRLWYIHYQNCAQNNQIAKIYDPACYIAKIKRAEANIELIEPAYKLYLEERRPYLQSHSPPEWTFHRFNLEHFANKVRHNRNLKRPDLFVSPQKIPPPAPVPVTTSTEAPKSASTVTARPYNVTFSVAGQPLTYHCSVAQSSATPVTQPEIDVIPEGRSVFETYPWISTSDLATHSTTTLHERAKEAREIDIRINDSLLQFKATQLPRHYGIHFLGAVPPQPFNFDGAAICDDPTLPQRRFSQAFPIYWKLTEDLNEPQTTAFKAFRLGQYHTAIVKSKSELEADIEAFYEVADDFRRRPERYVEAQIFKARLQNLRRSWVARHRAISSIDLIPPEFHYFAHQNVIPLNTYEGIKTRTGILNCYLAIRLGLLAPTKFEDTSTSVFVVEVLSSTRSHIPPIEFESLRRLESTVNKDHVDPKWRVDLATIRLEHYSEDLQRFPISSIEIYPQARALVDKLSTRDFLTQRLSLLFKSDSNYSRDPKHHLTFCNRFSTARHLYIKDCEAAARAGRSQPPFNEAAYLHLAILQENTVHRQQIRENYSNPHKRPGTSLSGQPQPKINRFDNNTTLPGHSFQQTALELHTRQLRTSIAAITLSDNTSVTTTVSTTVANQQGASRYPDQQTIPTFQHSIDNILQQHVPAADRQLPSAPQDIQGSSSDEDDHRLQICEDSPNSPRPSIEIDNPEDISDQPTDLTITKQV
jgi:hypothetical protein